MSIVMPAPSYMISKNISMNTLNGTCMHSTAPGLLSIANYMQSDDTLPILIRPRGTMRPQHSAYRLRSYWDAAVQVHRYGYEGAL